MAKIFESKLIPELATSRGGGMPNDWTQVPAWDINSINAIEDPAGASITRKITSYPSPLARIHLFNDAFEFANSPNFIWDTSNIYVQTISHCLDVWELLFNYEAFAPLLNFTEWTFDQIAALKHSTMKGHQLLGDALDLYINDGSKQFGNVDRLYIITYKNKVIAGSSPFTGFFTTASPIADRLSVPGNPSAVFFQTIRRLEDRDIEFQLFMHRLFYSQGVNIDFANLHKFIVSKSRSSDAVQAIYFPVGDDDAGNKYDGEYEPITNSRSLQMVLLNTRPGGGVTMKRFRQGIKHDCDFVIDASFPSFADKRILALKGFPEGNPTKIYVSGKVWDNNIRVPFYVPTDIHNRNLPGVNIQHPWVTISDFLEEYIVKVPYVINNDAFLTGGTKENRYDYLLPIKPLYFQFFTVEDLQKNFSLKVLSEGGLAMVDAELKIPIKAKFGKEFLTFRRRYQIFSKIPTRQEINDSVDGNGAIVNYQLGLMVFPFMRTKSVYDDFIKVGYLDAYFGTEDALGILTFYRGNKVIPNAADNVTEGVSKVQRYAKNYAELGEALVFYQIRGVNYKQDGSIGNIFDWAQLEIQPSYGLHIQAAIVPDWDKRTININRGSVSYAVDFGTTNTYVAHRVGGANPTALKLGDSELLVARLDKVEPISGVQDPYDHEGAGIITDIVRAQRFAFISSIIGGKYNFPTRTAVTEVKGMALKHQYALLGNVNIAFSLNRRYRDTAYNRMNIHTDLKWSPSELSMGRLEAFIAQLLYLMRYKTILLGCEPTETTVYWFVPLSMNAFLKSNLEKVWREYFQKIFRSTKLPLFISESEAPYYELFQRGRLNGTSILNVDIGGGTTDVVLIQNSGDVNATHIVKETSFSFAGNVLFGNYKDTAVTKNNGFVRAFYPEFAQYLTSLADPSATSGSSETREITKEYQKILEWYTTENNTMRSEDIVNFFFAVKPYDFEGKLRNSGDFKVLFMMFFAGLHYHCAQIIRDEKLTPPTDINHTGNGSRMLHIISTNDELLRNFIQAIYQHVLQNKSIKLSLHQPQDPKEATCHGALYRDPNNPVARSNRAEINTPLIGENLRWKNGNVPKEISYQDVYNATIDSQKSEYFNFLDMFFDILYVELKFKDNFNIQFYDPQGIKEYLKQNAEISTQNWVQWQRRKGANPRENINETMFFYAVMDGIAKLLDQIAKRKMGEKSVLFDEVI